MYAVVDRLDEAGKPAWMIAMIAGFVLFAPLGLAILAFMIWSGRMGCGQRGPWGREHWGESAPEGRHEHRQERWQRKMERMQQRMARWQEMGSRAFGPGFRPTGNRAFDEYRNEMIRRLEDEANEFRTFLDRLRQARDKAEFDQFMAERRNQPPATRDEPGHGAGGEPDPRPA